METLKTELKAPKTELKIEILTPDSLKEIIKKSKENQATVILTGFIISNLEIPKEVEFEDCVLKNCKVTKCRVTKCVLTDCIAYQCRFYDCALKNCTYEYSKFNSCDLKECTLKRCHFIMCNCELQKGKVKHCQLMKPLKRLIF